MEQPFATVSRRECFLGVPALAGLVAGLSLVRGSRGAEGVATLAGAEIPESFPSHDPRLVTEIVGASHGRIERVKELLALAPQLANAGWDAGFGDWETALGAASHVGNREIATLLMEHGARPDLFTFAMLGNLEAVRAVVTAQPGIEGLRGPHGLTLMHHARAGGEGAARVVEYLIGLPGADVRPPVEPLPDETRDAVIGEYAWGEGPTQRLKVFLPERPPRLSIVRGNGSPRVLHYLGNNAFSPVGGPDVRIQFTIEEGRATRMTITTPAPILEATRVG